MVPVLGVGDLFLVDPTAQPRAGDIVIYEPVTLGASLIVHRVVGGDAAGFLTQGDANPATDQQAGEPPVPLERIRGRVVTLPGIGVAKVPGAGVAIIELQAQLRQLERSTGGGILQTLALAALGVGALLLLLPATHPSLRFARPRSPRQARAEAALHIALPRGPTTRHVAFAAMASLLVSVVAGSLGAHEDVDMSLVVTDAPPPGQARSAAPGQGLDRGLEVQALAFLPTTAVLEALSPAVHLTTPNGEVPPAGTTTLHVEEVAGAAPGLQRDQVRVWRYVTWLPPGLLLGLHAVMPGLPNLLLGFALVLAFAVWHHSLGAGDLPLRLLRDKPHGRRWGG